MPSRPLTRTKRTIRQLGPLSREIQEVQNDLVKLARKLDRLQTKIADTEGWYMVAREEERRTKRERIQPESTTLLGKLNAEKADEVMERRMWF